jgi:hypothetical protein
VPKGGLSFDFFISERPPWPLLRKLFVTAIVVRWIYALALFAIMGKGGLISVSMLLSSEMRHRCHLC